MQIQPAIRWRMTWLMLAQTFDGIMEFMELYEWIEVKFAVLDEEAGPVGTGVLVYNRFGEHGVNNSSAVETS